MQAVHYDELLHNTNQRFPYSDSLNKAKILLDRTRTNF